MNSDKKIRDDFKKGGFEISDEIAKSGLTISQGLTAYHFSKNDGKIYYFELRRLKVGEKKFVKEGTEKQISDEDLPEPIKIENLKRLLELKSNDEVQQSAFVRRLFGRKENKEMFAQYLKKREKNLKKEGNNIKIPSKVNNDSFKKLEDIKLDRLDITSFAETLKKAEKISKEEVKGKAFKNIDDVIKSESFQKQHQDRLNKQNSQPSGRTN
ncbi:MAG: hypothetical protein Ta2D_10300 [Rickettsiales bacterium]|nr:MAG: hypothetical protein Ta2D_10300 [Rickettsiales bacterium]